MFLRLMFVLLIALNIAVGAWLLLGQPYSRAGMATDPGVPALRLLSELPEPAASAAPGPLPAPPPASVAKPVAAAKVETPAPAPSCVALGPFTTPEDLRRAREALSGQARRMRSRQEQVNQSHGWWVYLPAMATRAQALARARELAEHHIDDYFVVSSGEQPNTISLGLFKDQGNARKRRAEVIAAGFPAQVTERVETVPEYWLDLVVPGDAGTRWRSRVPRGVEPRRISCF
ncbi:SPOR domain-containing protein [Rhodanobacter caeni]|uniref:SPOR domain-containing protein n=1 Tax=Rhodanobacter caeni TaxID=657654 RepID=A0ABN0UJI5_9GAMM